MTGQDIAIELSAMEINLPFMGFGRVEDYLILGTWCDANAVEGREATEAILRKLLKASKVKLKAGEKQRLQWDCGTVCCEMSRSGELLYVVVTRTATYPEPVAYELLGEFANYVEREFGREILGGSPPPPAKAGSYSERSAAFMGGLARRFNNPEALQNAGGAGATNGGADGERKSNGSNGDSRLDQVNDKMNGVKKLMNENVQKILNNTEQINVLEDKAGEMQETAQEFEEKATELKDVWWWKDMKLRLIIFGLTAFVVLFIVYCISGRHPFNLFGLVGGGGSKAAKKAAEDKKAGEAQQKRQLMSELVSTSTSDQYATDGTDDGTATDGTDAEEDGLMIAA